MEYPVLTPDQRAAYDRDGFVLVRGLFDPDEALLLQKAMETDPQVRGNLYNRNDAQGLATKMVLWNHPGDSVYGLAARNNPYIQHHHPFYTPLEKVPDSAIKAAGLKYGSGNDESFLKTFVNPPELKKTLKI